jgi:hypothetical protein
MKEPEHRTMQAGRRYVLGQGEDFYGIWDRESPGRPAETFPLTDAGLQEATRRFAQLSQQDFWTRFGPKALRWALFGGLGVWILLGLVLWIRYSSFSPFPDFWIPGATRDWRPITFAAPFSQPVWFRVAEVTEIVAFRVWVAALAIIFALQLFDRGRQPT